MSADFIRPDYRRVKREVRRLHEELDLRAPPVDPVKVCSELGVNVRFVRFNADKQIVSGFLDLRDETIYVNSNEPPVRQTFTIAHELGHKLLHAEWARSAEYKVLMRDATYMSAEPHEKEANVFAANLLVPRFMLDAYRGKLTPQQMSVLFAVSEQVIRYRLSNEYGTGPG